MAPTLYMVHPSPPVRAVLMTTKAIGLSLVEKEVNLAEGEHLKPEYLKINPQHTVPTLVEENGFALWDSHAIMTYLVSKYGTDDSLYPKDLNRRAMIDQRLHFESGVVFPRLLQILVRTRFFPNCDGYLEVFFKGPIVRGSKTTIDQEDINSAEEVYKFLEAFVNGRPWIAGTTISVADYSLIGSISTLNVLVPVDGQLFPQVSAWLKRTEKLPEYEANVKGLEMYTKMIQSKLTPKD